MTILVMTDAMQITVENNKLLTKISRCVDCTLLRQQKFSDNRLLIMGEREHLYELLLALTVLDLGKNEII